MQKVALITGAAGGLGQALATLLTADGWELVICSREVTRLSEAFGTAHTQIVADCSTVDGAKHILASANALGKQPVALAHCVGNIRLGALHRMVEADFNDCMQANLFSAFHTLAAFVASLREGKQAGVAVLVSSAAARVGTPNHEAISAAKAGLEGLVRGAAATYAANNIRINAVAPGIMVSPATAKILGSELAIEAAAKQYPLPGIGSVEELAALMAWLLSERASRVTGQVWSMDAGFSTIRPLVK